MSILDNSMNTNDNSFSSFGFDLIYAILFNLFLINPHFASTMHSDTSHNDNKKKLTKIK